MDFAAARGEPPRKRLEHRPGSATRSEKRATQAPSTIAAVAQLIGENATPATFDRDLATICLLLQRQCGWSDESVSELRYATTVARPVRQPRPVRSGS